MVEGTGTTGSGAAPERGTADATRAAHLSARLFDGPGELRALCRALDWAATPLGPVAGWPLSLRTTVATLLASQHPMLLFWGPELVQLYNDAYRPLFGAGGRHPHALGQPARACWTENWDVIGPQIAQVMAGRGATWHEDQRVPFARNGRVETMYATYSYSPAFDDDGAVGGVLVIGQETTARVLTEERLQTLNRAVEAERARLADVFQHAPSVLAVLRGPDHVFTRVNDAYRQLIGDRDVLGKPVLEALPEVRAQGFRELMDTVLETGEPFVGREVPVRLARTPDAPAEERFVDFVYLPLVEPDGTRSGVIAHGTDVTEHVRARREVERLLADSEQARAALAASEARLRDEVARRAEFAATLE